MHPFCRAESALFPRARSLIGVGAALVVAILAVYAEVRTHEFVSYDDYSYVVQNARLRSGLGWRAIATDFLSPYFMNWSPLTMISLRIDFAIHELSAPGYLLTNVALHAIASLLVLLTFARATGSLWPAACVAFVFAIHPLHVESVAWVSSRKDVLSVTDDNFLAHKGLAVGLLRTGDLERAREHFEHALRIKPDWPPAQIGLGDTAMLAGNCAEAVEHYERALAVQPHEANARIALGLCYIKLGRPAEALPHLEFAHQLGNRSEALERALAIARDTR